MRVLLIAVSAAAMLFAPFSASAQNAGHDQGINAVTLTGSITGGGTGIVVPLPCPPDGECPNPWASQAMTGAELSADQIDSLYNETWGAGNGSGILLGTGVPTITNNSIGRGMGIVVPLPCPPDGECTNPWASHAITGAELPADQIDGLYNQNWSAGNGFVIPQGFGAYDAVGHQEPLNGY
jgi:hypothetical protein